MTRRESENLHIPPEADPEWIKRIIDHSEFSSKAGRLQWVLLHKFDDWLTKKIDGWNVVDLGCGSPISTAEDNGLPDDFEAWFPRMCALYGAQVVGIDMFEQDPKDVNIYDHRRANLVKLLSPESNGLIELLPNMENSLDIIHSFGAIREAAPSHIFARSLGYNILTFMFRAPDNYSQQVQDIHTSLHRQARILLKPGGMLVVDNNVWELTNAGELSPLTLD